MAVSEGENSRQATLEILEILDKYHISPRGAWLIFNIIMEEIEDGI